jgi:hypothetical protein
MRIMLFMDARTVQRVLAVLLVDMMVVKIYVCLVKVVLFFLVMFVVMLMGKACILMEKVDVKLVIILLLVVFSVLLLMKLQVVNNVILGTQYLEEFVVMMLLEGSLMEMEHVLDVRQDVMLVLIILELKNVPPVIQPMDITKLGQLVATPTQTASPTISNVMGAQTSSLAAQAVP